MAKSSQRKPIGDVKARFAEYIRAAEAGVTTVLTRHGRPVARLVPYLRDAEGTNGALAVEVRESGQTYDLDAEKQFRSEDARRAALRRLLEEEIRPRVPAKLRGKRIPKREREQILGYGEDGV